MENQLIKIAVRFNFWIRHFDIWDTPIGFAWSNTGRVITKDHRQLYKLANPIGELDRGRWMIIRMVENKEDPEKIKKAILKMGQFEKLIRQSYTDTGWKLDSENASKVLLEYYSNPEPDCIKYNGRRPEDYLQD